MNTGEWITVVLAVLGALLGLLGTTLGIAIRATLKNIELQLSHLGKDDTRTESSIAKLQAAIDEVQDEGRAADTHLGMINAELVTQVQVIRTLLEERFGRSTSQRFPKAKQLSEPPAFMPPDARVVVRSTGVENSGRYAAYVPPRFPKR